MVVRSIAQAKRGLSALIEEARKGHDVIIAPDFDTLPEDLAEGMGMSPPRE